MLDHADEVDQSSEAEPKAKATKRKLTGKEILSQAVTLLGGVSDTAVITLSFMAYQLALNPEIQEKLCQEVDALMEKNVSLTLNSLNDQSPALNYSNASSFFYRARSTLMP